MYIYIYIYACKYIYIHAFFKKYAHENIKTRLLKSSH